jgi:hypothetical protein
VRRELRPGVLGRTSTRRRRLDETDDATEPNEKIRSLIAILEARWPRDDPKCALGCVSLGWRRDTAVDHVVGAFLAGVDR